MHRRELLQGIYGSFAKGDLGAGVQLLEQLAWEGGSDRDMLRLLLKSYVESGRVQDHYRLVRTPAGAMLDAADLRAARGLYESQGMSGASLFVLETLTRRGDATADELLQLAHIRTRAGDRDAALAVARSLASRLKPGEHPPAGMFVIETLSKAGSGPEATRFLTRWLGPQNSRETLLAIAPALIERNRPELAVMVLRPRRQESEAVATAYGYALRMAARRSPELRRELTRELLGDLARRARGAPLGVVLYDLFQFGDLDMVIADLTAHGAWRQEPVRSAFSSALLKAGRKEKLRSLLLAEAANGRLSRGELSAVARELAALGYPGEAAGVLRAVAAAEGPASETIRDLLFLWRASGQRADVDWLVARAARASGEELEAWLNIIASSASADAAVKAAETIEATAPPGVLPGLAVLKARYLGWQADSPALRRALRRAAAYPLSVDEFSEVVHLACVIGDQDATAQLLATAGARRNSEVHECAARFAQDAARRKLDLARQALGGGDMRQALLGFAEVEANSDVMTAQDYYDYAQALERAKDPRPTAPLYEAALERSARSGTKGTQAKMLRAAILAGLHRYDEAEAVLKAALAEQPNAIRARLMLAELHLMEGDYPKALQVSGEPVRRR